MNEKTSQIPLNSAPSATDYLIGVTGTAPATFRVPIQNAVGIGLAIPYKFRAWRSASFNGTTSQLLLKFDTITQNTGSGYSTSSGLFTAPINGTYRFYARSEASGTTNYWLALFKNGTESSRGTYANVASSNFMASSVYDELPLTAGDTVGVYVISTSGTATGTPGANQTYFTGSLVSI